MLGSELDGNPAEPRAIWSREDPRFLGTVSTLHRLQYVILILSVYSDTPFDPVTVLETHT